jgi:hypothetical protein
MASLEEKIRALPPALQLEVEDYVSFLLERRQTSGGSDTPSFRWAGALRDMAGEYTSVSLQHALSDWRASHK